MSYADDEMIAAEEGPDLGPPRTREDWDQLFAALDAAENAPTIPGPPQWVVDEARSFIASRDLPVAMRESRAAFNFSWGTMNVGDPIVAAALAAAEMSEQLHYKYGAAYRCDDCLGAGILSSTFDWAGALFIHFLTCPHFAGTLK